MQASDPHYAEYLAAVSGMHDHTPSPAPQRAEPAVGDFVSGVTAGKRWSGHVEWIDDASRIVINVGGAWVACDPQDITH